jgi:hypothetical protein
MYHEPGAIDTLLLAKGELLSAICHDGLAGIGQRMRQPCSSFESDGTVSHKASSCLDDP